MSRRAAWWISVGVSLLLVPKAAQAEDAPVMVSEDGEAEQAMDAGPAEAPAAPVPAASAPPAPSESGLITVDFKDADIRQVLRVLSLKSGVDIVTSPDVESLVTIKLTNVPWEQALEIILRTYGFAYERKGRVIRVMTMEAVEQEALATEVFALNYAKAADASKVLEEMLSERGKAKFDERTNTLIVTDLPSSLFRLREVITRLDQATPQVHIESRFVEARLTRDENLGIDWFNSAALTITPATAPTTFPFPGGTDLGAVGTSIIPKPGAFSPTTGASLPRGRIPEVGGTFTFGTLSLGQLSMTLNMLKQRIETRVVSNPTIVTLDNKEAIVQVGTDVNIPNFQIDPSTGRATVTGFQTRSTGIILRVTPHVNLQGDIVLDVKPEITTIGANRDFGTQGIQFPDFNVQKAQTQVRLKDSQTLAIGGLKRQAKEVTEDKVPVLGDIPVVGWLFKNRRDRTPTSQDQLDLLIFLTVHLLEDGPATSVAAQPASDGP